MLGEINPAAVIVKERSPVVYAGRDNVTAAQFLQFDAAKRKDVPLDFSNASRLVLGLPEVGLAFDSAISAGCMDWSRGEGIVEFRLAQYAITPGTYRGQLIAFDDEHPNGQVVVSSLQTTNELVLTVAEVFSSGRIPVPLPTGGEAAVRTAGETIPALRVVYERAGAVYLLDPTEPLSEDAQFTLGITVTAADGGEAVVVQRAGTIDDAGWTWAEGLVFAGPAGLLTQTPPTTGWELVVGAAPSATRINIDFDEPVLLD